MTGPLRPSGAGRLTGYRAVTTPRAVLIRAIVLTWLGALAVTALIVTFGRILDHSLDQRPVPAAVWLTAGAAVLIAALCAALGVFLGQRSGARTERSLRAAVVGTALRPGQPSEPDGSGALVSLATHAVERAAQYRAGFLGPIIGAMTTPLLVLLAMGILLDWVTAVWLTGLLLIVPLLVGGFQRAIGPTGAEYRRAQAALTSAFLEAIQALGALVYARAAERVGQQLARRGERYRKGLMRMLLVNQLLILIIDAAFSLAIVAAATVIAVLRIGDGSLTLGGAASVLLLTTLVIGPVDVFGQFFYIGIGGRAAERQLQARLDTPPDAGIRGTSAPTPELIGAIEIDDLTAGWGREPVLTGLDLRVAPGERVAIVGPSGAGKSTLSAVLQGRLSPSRGRVRVSGLDVTTADPDLLLAQFSVVEQRAYLFLGSIADNLRLAAPGASEQELWRALAVGGLDAEVRAMPAGLDTQVGEHGTLLSGGQAQRVGIARAALRDAPILILDEPTSQVDLGAEQAILAALERLAAGRTVLMIAHRPGALLHADRVVDLLNAQGVRHG